LVVAREYSDLSQKLLSGEVDVCDLSPLNYVMAKQADPSLRLLVRQVATGSSTYSAYFVTRPESGIQSLADLRGRSVAYVDRLSASGYLFPAAGLVEAGLDPLSSPGRVGFLGSHEAVARAVLSGEYEVGALWSGAFDEMRATLPELRGLEVIYKSERIPFDGYVARGGLPPALLDNMRSALLGLSTRTPAGRRVLSPLPSQLNGFISAQDQDYEVVRSALRTLGEEGPAPLR
jgi:phosphate/phosphite/phosphonate ABC transporter binding protein